MDVYLLSGLLKELIIDNERIPLPGMGYFLTEPMPACFSEDGKTIYPPSKKISFKGDEMASRDLLSSYYAGKSGIDSETASTEIDAFLKQLKITLLDRKNIELPGLGNLRCTLDGNPYFIASAEGGIFSQAFGFEPVILKQIKPSVPQPEPAETEKENVQESIPAETTSDKEKDSTAPDVTDKEKGKDKGKVWIIVLAVLAIITVAAVILVTLGRSGHLDSLIYSDEELELIRQMGMD